MASEARRGIVRIGSNYARILTAVVLNIVMVPMLLHTVGNEGYGLIALLMATVGLSALAQQIVETSVLRELAAVHHENDGTAFAATYNSAVLIAAVAAVITLGACAILYLCLPLFSIGDDLIWAARWFVVTRAVQLFFVILLAPQMTMYLVRERMVVYNLWILCTRVANFAGAAVLLLLRPVTPVTGVIVFAVVGSGLLVLALVCLVGWIVWSDRRLIPRLGAIRRDGLRRLLGVGGWNILVIAAFNLHERVDAIIMNIAFGLSLGNALLGMSLQLSVIIQRVASGMTSGLSAVSARLTGTEPQRLDRLVYHSTRQHGLAAWPCLLGVIVLADPLVHIWVGGTIDEPVRDIPRIILLSRILAVGWAARSIADGWITILYGAGHIRRYAKWIVLGGVANPFIAGLLLYLLPDDMRYTGPALAFTIPLTLVHLFWLPRIGAPLLGLRMWDMISPLIRPAVATLVGAPALIIAVRSIEHWSIMRLLVVAAGYAMIYLVLTWLIVLNSSERSRVLNVFKRWFVH